MRDFAHNFDFGRYPFLEGLSVREHLVYFDRPLCSVLEDRWGGLFVAHFLRCVSKAEHWLIVPTSQQGLARILKGQKSLLSAFFDAPSMVSQLRTLGDGKLSFSHAAPVDDIGHFSQFLPNEEFYFEEDEFEDLLLPFEDIGALSRRANIEIFDLILTDRTPASTPVARLMGISGALQRIWTNLAHHVGDPNGLGKRGLGKRDIEDSTRFALTQIANKCVHVRFEAVERRGVEVDDDPRRKATMLLHSLFEADVPTVCTQLEGLPPRIRTNFLSFLATAQAEGTGIKLLSAAPYLEEVKTFQRSYTEVSEYVAQISAATVEKERTFEATGLFSSGKMEQGKFLFFDIESERSYEGDLGDDVDVSTLTLSKVGGKSQELYHVEVFEQAKSRGDGTTSYKYVFQSVALVRS